MSDIPIYQSLDFLSTNYIKNLPTPVNNGDAANKAYVDAVAGGANVGTADLDFGSGNMNASVNVTGQTGITSGSIVQAWLLPVDTSDHLADEHLYEQIQVMAGSIIVGTGFTIYGVHFNPTLEPIVPFWAPYKNTDVGSLFRPGILQTTFAGGGASLLYGVYKVAWRWS